MAAEVAQATSGARVEAEAALEAAATAKDRIESAAGEPMRDARVHVHKEHVHKEEPLH